MRYFLVALLTYLTPLLAVAMPPEPNVIPPADRQRLQAGADQLALKIDSLRTRLQSRPELLALLPDAQIYHKAVDWPLRYGELLDVKKADAALVTGNQRADQLAKGEAPWLTSGGVRAYVSRIDGSIQPYVLFVPVRAEGSAAPAATKFRLDLFFHGRNEKLMELEFISNKPPDSPLLPVDEKRYVVFPYGRYCCANKFAGEMDTLELLAELQRQYPIDPRRVVVAGFSMGGAACWHHAVHYTDRFVAASPGAGFVDTRNYQKMDESGAWAQMPEWRRQLMHLYDCPDYALNLSMLPTVAYAGDLDKQKAAGDVMEKAMADLGLRLTRVGAASTAHKYSPEAKQQIARLLDEWSAKPRDPLPARVRFATCTLRYNRMDWITVSALERHWARATVDATLDSATGQIRIRTQNVAELAIDFPTDRLPAPSTLRITIDSTDLGAMPIEKGRAFRNVFEKFGATAGQWRIPLPRPGQGLRKIHGLQGPIDDAFLDSFLIVRPSGKAFNEKVERWCAHELKYAMTEWRKIFRGEPRVKDDRDVTDADITAHNLILFGDPSSNAILAKIANRLPIAWSPASISVGDRTFGADGHALVQIYPNPLNPSKYIVLNSGFTFRQSDHKSNAWQVAKLPDYAVIDLSQPPDDQWPGRIAEAGFFDEGWRVTK